MLPALRTVVIIIVVWLVFNRLLMWATKELARRASTKKQKSNVEIFSRILKYLLLLILLMFAIFSYTGSLNGIGLSLGLLSAALGWALQKPITGMAAWIMVVIKRPFDIGDRIIIGNVRGDVEDITLSHLYLREVGGMVSGEENSGRIIMVPNAVLFEKEIINYTMQDEYVRDEVVYDVTYEGDLDEALRIGVQAAVKHTRPFANKVNEQPNALTQFGSSGVTIRIRYFVAARNVQHFRSIITKEIFENIRKAKNVAFAYPHSEVVIKKLPKR